MKTLQKSIKIKIENHSYTKEDVVSIERWEDEGGLPLDEKDMLSSIKLPLHPGEVFEVTGGNHIRENNELYYLAEINLLAY